MIHFVVAHGAEARPLIAAYDLAPAKPAPFPIYAAGPYRLVVSGQGALAAAAAVGVLSQWSGGERQAAWVNVGISGHPSAELGSVFRAHKISNAQRSWYPRWVSGLPCPSAPLFCRDAWSADYPEGLVDMESAGFVAAAEAFSTLELVQSVKVVSDNVGSPADRDTAAKGTSLLSAATPTVRAMVEALLPMVQAEQIRLQPPADLERLVSQHRFSTTQKTQLARLLRRRQALGIATPAFSHNDRARDILARLAL